MTTLTLNLPKPHPGQIAVISYKARFNVMACGRRFGKTTLGIDRIIRPMLDGRPVGWFSPTYKMLADVWREMKEVLQPVTRQKSEQEKRIEIITGGVLDMWSLDRPDAARGRKYARAVIDEAAMVPKLQEAWQEAIRPTLTDYAGDAFFLSTPKGLNYFKALFDYGNDPARQEWASWQLPTAANPFISPVEIDAARYELPERVFRQEYLAQFVEEANLFRNVTACATARPTGVQAVRSTSSVSTAIAAKARRGLGANRRRHSTKGRLETVAWFSIWSNSRRRRTGFIALPWLKSRFANRSARASIAAYSLGGPPSSARPCCSSIRSTSAENRSAYNS